MPEISVILPTYNGEHYIRESLDSILSQSYPDWELIAVNDCSTDRTGEIIEEYSSMDKRIRIIHNKTNQKLPASLNIGFRAASGRYFTWTSDDNRYHKDAFIRMKETLDANLDCGLVYAGMNFINEQSEIIKRYVPEITIINYIRNVIRACFMYRSEIMSTIGEYDIDFFCAEDYEYWLRIMSKYNIMKIDKILYDYRVHPQSLTSTKKELSIRQTCKVKEKYLDLIFNRLGNYPEYLFRFCLNYMMLGQDIGRLVPRVLEQCPSLQNKFRHISPTIGENKVIVFGAGKLGSEVSAMFGSRIIAFSDNDTEKIGLYKDGIPIISFDDMIQQSSKASILIAANECNCYEMICQLEDAGVCKYSIWQQIMHKCESSQQGE